MSASPFLVAVARDLFEQEWTRAHGSITDCDAAMAAPSQIAWLIPEFIELIEHEHHLHRCVLEPMIRRRIEELCFVDEAGDCAIIDGRQDQIDLQIEVIIRVLDQVHGLAVARGQWSDAPVTPQMFG